jgi:PII-like signaling protein
MRKGVRLQFYFPEGARHQHHLLHEWLLQTARDCGIKGGAAFRAIAGFGRHGHLHYGHFFEEAGRRLPVEVRLVTTRELADRLLELVRAEAVQVFYVLSEVEFGWIPADPSEG